MISIKKNDAPILPVCKMNCDDPLSCKLDKYELTKFMNTHTTNYLVGRPGSGKSSLLYSFFKSSKLFRKVFHNIYIFRPSASAGSMKDDIFSKVAEDQQYDELTYDNLAMCIDRLKATKAGGSGENNCIIFDDMGAYLKNKATQLLFKELIYNRRHLHTSIFFLCQTYKSIVLDLRKLFTNIIIFKVSKLELLDIFEEAVEQKKGLSHTISKLVYDKKYNFLFVNYDTKRMFKNWDEIIIDEQENV